jgi:hypothetical protein
VRGTLGTAEAGSWDGREVYSDVIPLSADVPSAVLSGSWSTPKISRFPITVVKRRFRKMGSPGQKCAIQRWHFSSNTTQVPSIHRGGKGLSVFTLIAL